MQFFWSGHVHKWILATTVLIWLSACAPIDLSPVPKHRSVRANEQWTIYEEYVLAQHGEFGECVYSTVTEDPQILETMPDWYSDVAGGRDFRTVSYWNTYITGRDESLCKEHWNAIDVLCGEETPIIYLDIERWNKETVHITLSSRETVSEQLRDLVWEHILSCTEQHSN